MTGAYNRKDHLYKRAKAEGYESRAAFKLIELDTRYKLLSPGNVVLDLGAWPGGWLQVASPRVGPRGIVVGIDLVAITDITADNVRTITGDVRDESTIAEALQVAGRKFDLVLSDMSPKLTGIKEADQAGTVGCAELAFYTAQNTLRTGGNFIAKVFKGNETEVFVKTLRPRFNSVARVELDSTRKTSNEFYIVGLGIKQ